MGGNLDLDEIRLFPSVRDPWFAAALTYTQGRDGLLLDNRQVRARCSAMRRRSLATPPVSTGCRRLPLAAAPEQFPSKPAGAGLQALVLCRLRILGQCFASLLQDPDQRHRPAESSPPHLGIVTPLLRFLDRALQRSAESRILPAQGSQRLFAARPLGKCACMFARHGTRIQEPKPGVQPWTDRSATECLLCEKPATGRQPGAARTAPSTWNERALPECLVEPQPGGGASTPSPHDRTLTLFVLYLSEQLFPLVNLPKKNMYIQLQLYFSLREFHF